MISTNLTRSLIATLVISTASAQTVTASIAAATPLTVTTSSPSAQTTTQPTGPLSSIGSIESTQGTHSARSSWLLATGPSGSIARWRHSLQGQASTGSHDVIVEWTASSPVDVYIEVAAALSASAGTPVPQIAIDIGDTGTFVQIGNTPGPTVFSYTLTTQPLPVRLRFSNALSSGSSLSHLTVAVTPNNNLAISQFASGCFGTSMALSPQFADTGIIAQSYQPPINALTVLVVGLAPQPIALPPLFGMPCLLLPRPDVLLPFFAVQSIEIPLPAAVRPVNLWVQRVGLIFGQLVTFDAYMVNAF